MIFKLGDLEVLKQNDNYVFNEKLGKLLNTKTYMSIVSTNKCNRHCAYCINSKTDCKSDLPFEKAIENITKAKNEFGIKECVILGGEPTLYKKLPQLIDYLRFKLNFEKVVMTTNGVALTDFLLEDICSSGLTHLNVSLHSNKDFISLKRMKQVYSIANAYGVMVRVNTNVWRGNHDTVRSLVRWLKKFQNCSDSIRVSNIIVKDGFFVNPENNEETYKMKMSDEEYNKLFDGLINHYSKKMSCINNPTALGFVDYTMIPTKSAIIVNRNIDSKVAEQICENEEAKVNTIKCLVSGNLSLSWNENNKIEL